MSSPAGLKAFLSTSWKDYLARQRERRQRALELLSLLSGAVSMARALDDHRLSAEIIASARKRADKLIDARRLELKRAGRRRKLRREFERELTR
jgi:TetR/AcrR family transcriptional regulator, transcriptional repressor for nem operon